MKRAGITPGLSRSICRMVALGLSVTVVLSLGLVAGCADENQAQEAAPQQPAPARVPVVQVAARTVTLERTYPARVQAADSVEVRARVQGILLERKYDEGSRVKSGTVLFEIDRAPYEARVQQAEAEISRARAQLRQGEREWKRVSALFKENAVSARQRDEAQSALELGQAAVANAEAALRTARIDLGYARVTAPISGITGLQAVSPGNLVEPGTLLTTIRQLDPVHVLFSLPEVDALAQRRQLGLVGSVTGSERPQALVRLPDGTVYEREGVIDFVAANVDPETGTVQSRAVFPNPQSVLVPGQFLRVSVQGLKLPNVVVVPPHAVAEGPEGRVVYVVNEQNIAQPRSVTLGPSLEQGQVIAEGLEGGERVVVGGIASVQPGQPVQPVETAQDQASAPPPGDASGAPPGESGAEARAVGEAETSR